MLGNDYNFSNSTNQVDKKKLKPKLIYSTNLLQIDQIKRLEYLYLIYYSINNKFDSSAWCEVRIYTYFYVVKIEYKIRDKWAKKAPERQTKK